MMKHSRSKSSDFVFLVAVVDGGHFEDIRGYLICFDGEISRFFVSRVINYIMPEGFAVNFLFYKLSFFI